MGPDIFFGLLKFDLMEGLDTFDGMSEVGCVILFW